MGIAILTCKNHPTYRWTHTKYGPGYIGSGVLMFDGEEGGKPGSAFNMNERQIEEHGEEFAVAYRERWTPECTCPYGDLEFLHWADEKPPASAEEARAQVEAIGTRIKDDLAHLQEHTT